MKKNKNKFQGSKIVLASLISCTISSLLAGVSFAISWYAEARNTVNAAVNGSVVEEYFHCGSGMENDPFVITRPIHYYHLVEFFLRETSLEVQPQDVETFTGQTKEVDGVTEYFVQFGREHLYFEIGYDFGDGKQVYEYNSEGKQVINEDGTPHYTNNLNMAYYSGVNALMPIGTSELPFIGSFNGNDLEVSNLNIVASEEVFVESTGTNVTRYTSDIGIFGYLPEGSKVSNVYFDSPTIDLTNIKNDSDATEEDAHTDHEDNNAYFGYIVGHLESHEDVTNTYVDKCDVVGAPVIGTNYFVKNNLGYYGYCEDAMELSDIVTKLKGQDTGWGGSMNMNNMYQRLTTLYTNTYSRTNNNYILRRRVTSGVDGSTNEEYVRDTRSVLRHYTSDINNGNYKNTYGSLVTSYSTFTNGAAYYLTGGTIVENYEQYVTGTEATYYIYSGGNYLSYTQNGNNYTISNATSTANAAKWRLSTQNGTGQVYTVINGTRYYLTGARSSNSNGTVSLSTNSANANIAITNNTGTIIFRITYFFTTNSYYLRYNGGWNLNTTSNNISTANAGNEDIINTRSSGPSYVDYTGNNNTILPLLVNGDYSSYQGSEPYAVNEKNTGYIISGAEDETTTGTWPEKAGDIRVSRYGNSSINGSYTNNNIGTVYTINDAGNAVAINANDYEKYNDYIGTNNEIIEGTKNEFQRTLRDSGNNVYGLHFMDALISKDNLVTAQYALVNGREYQNYEMPANSIDFNVSDKGSINFFAGNYFTNNNSFFSLNKIVRDENDKIEAIKEIDEIYSDDDPTHSYVYKYRIKNNNGTYSYEYSEPYLIKKNGATEPWPDTFAGNYPNGYSLRYSLKRIRINTSISKNTTRLFYFEIPIDAGEYALGSVDGGTGAYLLYLDIGTNGGYADANKTVYDFGAVEYRPYNETIGTSIFLFSYEQQVGTTVEISVSYSDKKYYVTISSSTAINVDFALLNAEYSLYVNDQLFIEEMIAFKTYSNV